MKKLYEKVLEKNCVTEKDYKELLNKVDGIIGKLSSALKKKGIIAEIMLGGSAAKGTIIKGDFDFDIFVRFSKKYDDSTISDLLADALKIFKNVDRVHGSRDYFQLMHEGLMFEFVPVIKIEKAVEARNVTDVSPLHVDWILSKIEKNPELRSEIILAKLFCKAHGIYGAESYISGFSGHVIDILIVYYGSFEGLIKNSAQWQHYKVIDIEGHDTANKINESKISPLIVIDPIQKERNAAAALSSDKFEAFRKRTAEFLNEPSEDFFTVKKITDDDIIKNAKGNRLILLKVKAKEGKRDVVGGKLLKVFNCQKRSFEEHDFEICSSGWDWDKKRNARMWFMLKKEMLPEWKIFEGPPINAKVHVERFRNAHENSFEKDGRIYAEIKREYREPEKLLKSLTQETFIKEKVEEIKVNSYDC
jgi:tRNA nucleotidyltransferase (CCA-adding enzyme)